MKKMLFIYNPNAGRGDIKDVLSEVIGLFCDEGYLPTVLSTSGPGDARNIVSEIGGEYDRIVCCGGDGTLNEVTDGLMTLLTPPPCGYMPTGTVNDFARSFRLPSDMFEAAKVAVTGTPFWYDIGEMNGDFFDYIAAFGAFTEVSYETPQASKNVVGKLAYFLEGVKRLASIRTYKVKITIGEEVVEDEIIYGMVSNSFSVGGFLTLFDKEATLDDGYFEALFIRAPKNFMELQAEVTALMSSDVTSKYFIYRQVKEITVSCEEEISWTIDGEYGGSFTEAVIKNHQKAVQFVRSEE